jgi:3-methyladenine DNA glycosylase AlkD
MNLQEIRKRLKVLSDRDKARELQRFFKTSPGEYGAGDRFLGIRVPALRRLARELEGLSQAKTVKLLHSPYHEERLLALLIMVDRFSKSDTAVKKSIYEIYLNNTVSINNWDLVDITAQHIIGAYLFDKNREPLYRLAASTNLWERRISIMATFHFIKQEEFEETLRIAEILLNDREDLIHKAVGWMLREIGKRNLRVEETFLGEYYMQMPRTMLRYAIEKFPENKRQKYLKGLI